MEVELKASLIPVSQENIPKEEDIRWWPYLDDVHLNSIKAEVDLLIGVNVPKAMEPLKVINSQGDGPYAVQRCLGWLINGPLSSNAAANMNGGRSYVTSNRISVARLEKLLINQCNQDFSEQAYNEKKELSYEDKQFLTIANDSIKVRDGHYELRLPFRKENINMPNNREVAEQRALNLLKRFRRDESFLQDYRDFMKDGKGIR